MTEILLDRLVSILGDAAKRSDPNIYAPPLAIIWPDGERQWENAIELLRPLCTVLVLGQYEPSLGIGPAYWIRCVASGTIPYDGPPGLPIVYLPGVSIEQLRSASASDPVLAPLVPLQYRSQCFVQSKMRDWTIRSILVNKEVGVGLHVAGDPATAQSLAAGLRPLLQQPVAQLAGRYVDSAFLNNLLNPDPVRLLLRWINDPIGVREELSGGAWDAFVAQCKSELSFAPDDLGVLEAARRLGLAEGPWEKVWQRFRESPADYPGIPARLREAKPFELFTDSNFSWPQDNESAEDELRKQLMRLRDRSQSEAFTDLRQLEAENSDRRGSVWAQLGESPLAFALEHLSQLVDRCIPCSAPNVDGMRHFYMETGWKADLAALQALGEVDDDRDVKAVAAALDAVYRPWLETGAKQLQDAIGPEVNSGTYVASGPPQIVEGEAIVFVDGLRLDLAHLLAERLEGAGASVITEVGLAALPTVTQTSKPALVPISQELLGPGEALDACRISTGTTASIQTLRALLGDAGVQVLASSDLGNPTGRAWTETGEIDHKGHDSGARLAREVESEVTKIARRARELLDAGWSTVTIVTDHGWLLLPSGLPKNESLPVAATLTKKGRCARTKDGASVQAPTVPWHWDRNVRIAVASGISCFEANRPYEHGGVSPQECFVPRLVVSGGDSASTPSRAELTSVKWRGLTLVVEFSDLPDRARVDLRLHAGDPASSIAALARFTSGTGKVILIVEDDDLEGVLAQLVVTDSSGALLLQRETTVGQNR